MSGCRGFRLWLLVHVGWRFGFGWMLIVSLGRLALVALSLRGGEVPQFRLCRCGPSYIDIESIDFSALHFSWLLLSGVNFSQLMSSGFTTMRDRVGTFGIVNPQTGEINEVELSVRRSGKRRTITSMYGPNWLATPVMAHARLTDFKSVSAYRVLHYLLSQMDAGNEIKVRVADISSGLSMAQQQASRALAELKAKGIILDRVPFGFRLHPDFGWRGDPTGKVIKSDRGLELT